MADYSNSVSKMDIPFAADVAQSSAPKKNSTIYGIDSAIVIVVLAALSFWACIGAAAWYYL